MAFGCFYFLIILISLKMLVTEILHSFPGLRSMMEKETIKQYNYQKSPMDHPVTG